MVIDGRRVHLFANSRTQLGQASLMRISWNVECISTKPFRTDKAAIGGGCIGLDAGGELSRYLGILKLK